MAEAARTTKHYVSDCLEKRYPYDASQGFLGIRQREAGRVFNGYSAPAVDDMMNSLTDPSVTTEEKTKAVHHLYARSASQETKIDMLKKGIVPLLIVTLRSCTELLLHQQCMLLLRSLAVLPQGCLALVREGIIPMVTATLRTRSPNEELSEAAQNCCIASAHVLYQLCSNMSGLRWVLGLAHDAAFEGLDIPWAVVPSPPEELIFSIADAAADEATPAKATAYLFQTLACLTSLERGVKAFLAVPSAMDALVERVKRLPKPPTCDIDLCAATLEATWNVGLGHLGGAVMEERGVPDSLFELLATVSGSAADVPLCVQRQLTGALSALSQLTSVKRNSTCTASSIDHRTRIIMLIDYVSEWNSLVATQYSSADKPVPGDAVAILSNVVQCIRLASELKTVRDVTHALLDAMEQEDATKAFYFRRQLYFHTRWEAEYDACVEV